VAYLCALACRFHSDHGDVDDEAEIALQPAHGDNVAELRARPMGLCLDCQAPSKNVRTRTIAKDRNVDQPRHLGNGAEISAPTTTR
jgi:hypothetical protein